MSQLVLLIRHAQSQFPPHRLVGWTPGVGLSEQGRQQASDLAGRLKGVRLAALYSSPLDRCLQTAQAVAEGRKLEVVVEEQVGEVKLGAWQGRALSSVARTPMWRLVQFVPSQAQFPSGETIRELQRRGVEAVESIRGRHRRGTIAIVSHADTIKAVAAHYLGMHLDLFQRLVIANASVTAIGFGDGFPRVLRLSDTGAYDDFVPSGPRSGAPRPRGRS
ncbi:MAG TPA: MSMEG_4193 family putative phosphomutase [Actinomycetota bacterium]|nr:MSMEG_4193 family putative phosphomutase [Actinomycetota bacterium]